ncbi:hypothetical protein EVJ58_g3444 [Rhodofomes roseus]|uniref:DUF6589 domain-containing protein n=1 Tax=Rhodofomes roseus TaxID=34475 RepID=A0A4Y9YPX3_9APHY|nr:hypothetical protein EVJ58_g3444 [Rhodofomes roseus]
MPVAAPRSISDIIGRTVAYEADYNIQSHFLHYVDAQFTKRKMHGTPSHDYYFPTYSPPTQGWYTGPFDPTTSITSPPPMYTHGGHGVPPAHELIPPVAPRAAYYPPAEPYIPMMPPVNWQTPPPVYPGFASPSGSQTPRTPTRKRKRTSETENVDDEDGPHSAYPSRSPLTPSKGRNRVKRQKTLTIEEKLELVLTAIIDEAHWTFGEFLYYALRSKDEYGKAVHGTSERHVNCIRHFLQGSPQSKFTPAMLADTMLCHPYGSKQRKDLAHEGQLMYSTTTNWKEIKSVRPALTSWAAQKIFKQLTREADEAVKPENGLHAMQYKKAASSDGGGEPSAHDITWADIGSATVLHVEDILKRHQPLTWAYVLAVAERSPAKPNQPGLESHGNNPKAVLSRKYRPSRVVALHALTSLNFSRTNRANLFPTATGILYFAMSAPVDLIHYGSRLGIMPTYNTIYKYLENFAEEEARVVRAHGSNPATASMLWLDNVQNYHVQRDVRLGERSHLNSGLAATYIEGVDCDVGAFDLAEKHRLLGENKRCDLTVEQLLGFIDSKHRESVGTFHFLRALVDHIPELARYKDEVSALFRTRGRLQQVPVKKSRVHPLASSGKKETITTELKDAMIDFLEQAGQMPTSNKHSPRLILVGGDGLTYEKLVQLKNYLGVHQGDTAVESLDIVEPVLALWHTGWTEACRIFATHWGSLLSRDESTLGHSAIKMGRTTPTNLNKVDYKEGMEIILTVLDARILDCFRVHWDVPDLFAYFTNLANTNRLPSLKSLEEVAEKLYAAYATSRGYERAMHAQSDFDRNTVHEENAAQPPLSLWEQTVPIGRPWVPPTSGVSEESPAQPTVVAGGQQTGTKAAEGRAENDSQASQDELVPLSRQPSASPPSLSSATEPGKPASTTSKASPTAPIATRTPFRGDRVLAQSIAFMRDAVILREFVYATCEGDVGRVYEALKVMLFTFAGSTHSKYTTYLLETITNLELESTPSLRHAILSNLLVNLTGEPGSFQPGDLMQEYFNRLLEAVVQRKGVKYDDHFVRDIISRNLHHFASLLNDLKSGVGLQRRSGRHTAPHLKPEFKILAGIYHDSELHLRRRGREYHGPAQDVDDFRRGYRKLKDGKLKKWITESTFSRSVRVPMNTPAGGPQALPNEDNSGEADDVVMAESQPGGHDVDEGDNSEPEDEHGTRRESHAAQSSRQRGRPSLASACMVNGQLVIETLEVGAAEIDQLLAEEVDDGRSELEGFDKSESELGDNDE